MRRNMVPRQPAHRVPQQCLKCRYHAGLKTDKANNLVDDNNVVGRQADLIKLQLRFAIDNIR
ncbi:hypothetical protein D3C81_1952570 [compost metagenome]